MDEFLTLRTKQLLERGFQCFTSPFLYCHLLQNINHAYDTWTSVLTFLLVSLLILLKFSENAKILSLIF